ncbi:MAG: nucleoside triphosphate pyrophosphohydrolase [Alphaproteobacteria bacterium]|nr:nucleoside triphosphate pyrophosphohydrolase [Alphaproteobacteria bacterium]
MSEAIDRLTEIMALLRGPNGCPWDRKQTFKSIAHDTIEETYEIIETIENGDMEGLRDELGDLLLQIVFYAQMAREDGLFDLDDVAAGLTNKLIERHPHVFGEEKADTAKDVKDLWESGKAKKRAKQAEVENRAPSLLDGVTTALPATTRAFKLSERVARVGFDWPDANSFFDKIREELAELKVEVEDASPREMLEDEMGDVLFTLVCLARHLKIDPETALRSTNRKFERRFRAIETRLAAQGRTPAESNLEEMDRLWDEAKAEKKS